jgi:hypothetical protein
MKDERIDSTPIEGETTTIVIARERSDRSNLLCRLFGTMTGIKVNRIRKNYTLS